MTPPSRSWSGARQDPSDRTARSRLVKMYLVAGRLADAQKLLATVLAANPKDADALLQRSELSIDAGKYQDAQNDLNLVLRYRPDTAGTHVFLARLQQAQGRALNQRQELAEALRLDPSLLDVRLDLARLLIASKGAAAALEILDQAPESQKRAIPVIVESNWARLDLGRRAEARKWIAFGLQTSHAPDLLLQDALLKMSDQDYSGARASLDALCSEAG